MIKLMDKVANSYWYDVVGLVIMIGGCVSLGFATEPLAITPAFKSGFDLLPAAFPIGLVSIISAVLSLESDRFESRLSNLGNWIGIPSILLTMFVDMMFGNQAAWITYPVTFLIQIVAVIVWHHFHNLKVNDWSRNKIAVFLVVTSVVSFAFSYFTNGIGFTSHGILFWTTTFAFAVSLVANLTEMIKLPVNNKAWVVYNIVQLGKAIAQMNIANILKIAYYLINNAVSIVSWSKAGRRITARA